MTFGAWRSEKDIQTSEGVGCYIRWKERTSYIHRISSRTTAVTRRRDLKIKLCFATSAKENTVVKKPIQVFTVKNCNGKEQDTETHHSSNPAPDLRKSDMIAPESHNYFVTGSGLLHIFPHHFLPPSPVQKGRWWISHCSLSHTSLSLWQQRTSFSAAIMLEAHNQIS